MISNKFLFELLKKNGIGFFSGVPDSSLKNFCAYITEHTSEKNHVIAANEGGAIALAAGHFLASGNPALVYMQNSGQGNAVNPLASLADSEVYGIPMLLMIGWRGEPGTKDEPQHIKQGKITLSLLDTLEIPYQILPENEEDIEPVINKIFNYLRTEQAPIALVVRKGSFKPYEPAVLKSDYSVSREEAIYTILDNLDPLDVIVSTTGKTSREVYEYRDSKNQGHERDFLTVGSMGHTSQIALGIAMEKQDRQVFCLDGDGAMIMHMGGLAIIGSKEVPNFKHIVFNNGAHESVGGQPTVAQKISLTNIAKECAYKHLAVAESIAEIEEGIKNLKSSSGPALLEVRVKLGARSDLGRPKTTPQENKKKFMEFLNK